MRLADRYGRWRFALSVAVLLLFSRDSLHASDPDVERAIEAQNRLAEEDRGQVIQAAKNALDRRDTAANHYLLGRAYGLMGDFGRAREQFDWALERDPAFSYGFLGIGICEILLRRHQEARTQFEAALKLDPQLTRARVELGRLALLERKPEEAADHFLEVLRYEPKNLDVRLLLGRLYLRDKRHELAVREFETILRYEDDNVAARKDLALGLAFLKKIEEAIREFERVVVQIPKDLECYLFLKDLYLQKGDKASAIGALRRLIANAPEKSPATGEAEDAIKAIEEGRQERPEQMSLSQLLEKLASPDVKERREAMRIFVDLQLVPILDPVLRAVTDEDVVVRVLAVRNLGRTGGRYAVGLLELLMLHPKDRDQSEEVRGAAARALSEVDSPGALPVLIAALTDDSLYVFRLVVESLRTETGAWFVEDPAVPITEEQRAEVIAQWRGWWRSRRAFAKKLDAIEALVGLKIKRMAVHLLDLLTDDNVRIAAEARKGFISLTGVEIGRESDVETPEGRKKLLEEAVKAIQSIHRKRG